MPERTRTIPLFPLPLCVFPGEPLPLHIFEDQYKELVAYCLEPDPQGLPRLFGISYSTTAGMHEVGCAVMIERVVKRYEDGKLDIITSGRLRYLSRGLVEDRSYSQVKAEYFDDHKEDVDDELRTTVITLHMRLHELVKGKLPRHQFSAKEKVSFTLAHDAGLTQDQRQNLLEIRSENQRLRALAGYYRAVIPVIQEREDIKERVQANGHFRKFGSVQI